MSDTGDEPDEPRSLAEQMARLREDVDLLLLTRDGTSARASTPDTSWQALSPARAADAWAELTEWVDELLDRYALDETIPNCWYAHGAMVEELHALHVAWLGVYAGRPSQPSELSLWHELLARTLARLREWNRHGCAGGTHRADDPAVPDEEQCTARAAFVHADLQARARRDGATPIE
jgi:hypothetical protein